jgi:hypothetical protein
MQRDSQDFHENNPVNQLKRKRMVDFKKKARKERRQEEKAVIEESLDEIDDSIAELLKDCKMDL